jgi:lysophospholipase L1-like esterase
MNVFRKSNILLCLILFLAFQPIASAKVTNSVTWWGDSLTAGAGGNGVTAPSELAKILKIPVLNKGVGGEGSSEIAVRSGARKISIKFWGAGKKQGDWTQYQVLPDRNILRQGTNLIAGSVENCIAILKFDGNLYSIKLFKCKKNFADSTANFEIVGLETTNARYQIIWAGRNNGGDSSTVVKDVNSMITLFRKNNPSVKIYVLSVINGEGEGVGSGAYAGIQGVNLALRSLNIDFIDVRQCLIQDALRLEKLAPTAQDSADIQNDLVPSQLRSDGIHLNAYGYHAVAVCVASAIKKST